MWRERQAVRAKFGYMAQKFSLYPDLTVLENLRFFGGAYHVPRARLGPRIDRLLTANRPRHETRCSRRQPLGWHEAAPRLGVRAGSYATRFSFSTNPPAASTRVHRQQMWNLLYDLSNEGMTIFVTTHYMGTRRSVARRSASSSTDASSPRLRRAN